VEGEFGSVRYHTIRPNVIPKRFKVSITRVPTIPRGGNRKQIYQMCDPNHELPTIGEEAWLLWV
jgi:hypothetical protein